MYVSQTKMTILALIYLPYSEDYSYVEFVETVNTGFLLSLACINTMPRKKHAKKKSSQFLFCLFFFDYNNNNKTCLPPNN
jgi:multisubunit Na+/H+ antiporter MnhE subunit